MAPHAAGALATIAGILPAPLRKVINNPASMPTDVTMKRPCTRIVSHKSDQSKSIALYQLISPEIGTYGRKPYLDKWELDREQCSYYRRRFQPPGPRICDRVDGTDVFLHRDY